jgi:hypothetical protein
MPQFIMQLPDDFMLLLLLANDSLRRILAPPAEHEQVPAAESDRSLCRQVSQVAEASTRTPRYGDHPMNILPLESR